LPIRRLTWVSRVWAITRKDLVSEFRTRYALNAVVMFAIITLTVVSISLGVVKLDSLVGAALFWIVFFFASMSGLAQSFVKEEENGTALLLKISSDGSAVLFGKIFFNLILLCLLAVILVPLFILFIKLTPQNWPLFLVIVLLGIIGLAGATTLVAAIVSKASMKSAVFSVLSFPLLFPFLLAAVEITRIAFDGGTFADAWTPLKLTIAYEVVITTLSVLLFDSVWLQQ